MGLGSSAPNKDTFEPPSPKCTATIYYFQGRGLADQIRWLLAASNISFAQKSVTTREKFLKMAESQLAFGQLPLLQIDDHEIVQSQAAIRYIAKRANLMGSTVDHELKCDMIVETIREVLSLLTGLPFVRDDDVAFNENLKKLKEKWAFVGMRFEKIILFNGAEPFLVGDHLTYADVLMAHLVTWITEEAGVDVMFSFPKLVDLQLHVMALPQISAFIKSVNYFPLGDEKYVRQVETVLGRKCGPQKSPPTHIHHASYVAAVTDGHK